MSWIWQKVIFGLEFNRFEFSFPSHRSVAIQLCYYLSIAAGRIVGFIPFPRVLVLCEMQTASSGMWTPVVVTVSYASNHYTINTSCPVGWGCRIHWPTLQRGKTPPPNECCGYDNKQSDGEAQLMLELWGMWSTLSLPSLPGPLWPGVVALDRVLSLGQIELNCELMLNWIVWNRTV